MPKRKESEMKNKGYAKFGGANTGPGGGGGRDSAYERGGEARLKLNPWRRPIWGVAQPFFDP